AAGPRAAPGRGDQHELSKRPLAARGVRVPDPRWRGGPAVAATAGEVLRDGRCAHVDGADRREPRVPRGALPDRRARRLGGGAWLGAGLPPDHVEAAAPRRHRRVLEHSSTSTYRSDTPERRKLDWCSVLPVSLAHVDHLPR